ncbi:DUF317 domain-containing protein [Streptomyces sp. 4.24]|uniref:DUF317 domain-containing protein n=1 Tax=Streptomyces tritrimontium TaxID=3406573 RepID=UPI003BB50A1D
MTTYAPTLLTDDGEPSEALDILAAAGWESHSDPAANLQVVAPNGRVRVLFQPESLEYANTDVLWRVEATGFEVPAGDGLRAIPAAPTRWAATFTGEVPVTLIGAFLDRMVAPVTVDQPADADRPEATALGA